MAPRQRPRRGDSAERRGHGLWCDAPVQRGSRCRSSTAEGQPAGWEPSSRRCPGAPHRQTRETTGRGFSIREVTECARARSGENPAQELLGRRPRFRRSPSFIGRTRYQRRRPGKLVRFRPAHVRTAVASPKALWNGLGRGMPTAVRTSPTSACDLVPFVRGALRLQDDGPTLKLSWPACVNSRGRTEVGLELASIRAEQHLRRVGQIGPDAERWAPPRFPQHWTGERPATTADPVPR
jgi:hypothetical protein